MIVALVALVFSGTAWGKCHSVTKGGSSVTVYIEQIPTSCGSKPVRNSPPPSPSGGTAATGSTGAKVATGGKVAAGGKVATGGKAGHVKTVHSHRLGAPRSSLRGNVRLQNGRSPLLASLGALGGGSGVTLVLMVVTAIALFGFRVYRRRGGW